MSDWFEVPKIHGIEKKKGRIRVRVSVLDEDGQVLEAGEAVRKKGDWWEFASRVQGRTILAEAWDLPCHVTRLVTQP